MTNLTSSEIRALKQKEDWRQIASSLKQLTNLLELDLPLEEIAHRMAMTSPDVRRIMKLMRIDHEGLHRPLKPDRFAAAATRRRKRRANGG